MKKEGIWTRLSAALLCAALILTVFPVLPETVQAIGNGVHETNAIIGGILANQINATQITTRRTEAWKSYKSQVNNNSTVKSETTPDSNNVCYMTYNGPDGNITMKYYIKTKGRAPSGGYPLYIALHGGGSSNTPELNDNQWADMKMYYFQNLSSGIYVAVRGIRDTWNTHFNPESYPLYDRLIQNLIVKYNVNPNKVYLMGFSAGGDGVYAITPRMADRFAAANMSSGHPNGISMLNMKNVPITLQAGEVDPGLSHSPRQYWVARYEAMLNALKSKYGGYTNRALIHFEHGHNFADSLDRDGRIYNRDYFYYSNDEYWYKYYNDYVMRDTQAWFNAKKNGKTYNDVYDTAEYYPPKWINDNNYVRNPLPTEVVWNLSTRAPLRSVESFYWLSAPKTVNKGIIRASYNKSQNLVVLNTKNVQDASYNENSEEVEWYTQEHDDNFDFEVLLNEQMVDFSSPVTFEVDGARIRANVVPDSSVLETTTAERGDPNYQFVSRVSYSTLQELLRTNHSLTKTNAKAATLNEDGNIQYWTCSTCGESFADEACTKQVDVTKTVDNGGVIIKAFDKGTYLRMGRYNGYDVDWYCMGTTDKGLLMLCKYVLKQGSFDDSQNSKYIGSNPWNWFHGMFVNDLKLTEEDMSVVREVDLSDSYGSGSEKFFIPSISEIDLLPDTQSKIAYLITNPSSASSYCRGHRTIRRIWRVYWPMVVNHHISV